MCWSYAGRRLARASPEDMVCRRRWSTCSGRPGGQGGVVIGGIAARAASPRRMNSCPLPAGISTTSSKIRRYLQKDSAERIAIAAAIGGKPGGQRTLTGRGSLATSPAIDQARQDAGPGHDQARRLGDRRGVAEEDVGHLETRDEAGLGRLGVYLNPFGPASGPISKRVTLFVYREVGKPVSASCHRRRSQGPSRRPVTRDTRGCRRCRRG